MAENSDLRHRGQLHGNSFLPHQKRFAESDLHAGSVFTADLERLLVDVQKWDECLQNFQKSLDKIALTAEIKDGGGPVAHHVGARFNHRIGTAGGVGYAAHAYAQRLEDILLGLIETTRGYAKVEDSITDDLNGAS